MGNEGGLPRLDDISERKDDDSSSVFNYLDVLNEGGINKVKSPLSPYFGFTGPSGHQTPNINTRVSSRNS